MNENTSEQSGTDPVAVVILAAGKGTRMRSSRPKVLHEVGGAPLLHHAMRRAMTLAPERIVVVVGHGPDAVAEAARAEFSDARIALQADQKGTGHAVQTAVPELEGVSGALLVLYADTPFLAPDTLTRLVRGRRGAALGVLGFETAAPGRYGRLVRAEDGGVARIVEAKDASDAELAITLCNSGVMAGDSATMTRLLQRLAPDNAQGELYLTDLVALARADGESVALEVCDEAETLGVNSRVELARAEATWQALARHAAMLGGATLTAPETVHFSHDTVLGEDVTVEPHVVFGSGVRVAEGARIRAFSHLEGADVGAGCVVGPYARLRPGTRLAPDARVGNFVEVKNAEIGAGAKANHLTYVGDATVGAGANLGAGTVTCNYDGFRKHRTAIGPGAFIGVNTALVAPVSVGASAYVATGTVVTRDVPEDALAIARTPQVNRKGTAKRLREKLAEARDRSAGGPAKKETG